LFGFSLLLGVVAIMIWLLVATVFRYSSLAAILVFILCPLVALFIMDQQHAEFTGFMAVLIVARHFENILRLVRGQESKISLSK